eukprot:3488682-Rhodomonas_salina.2
MLEWSGGGQCRSARETDPAECLEAVLDQVAGDFFVAVSGNQRPGIDQRVVRRVSRGDLVLVASPTNVRCMRVQVADPDNIRHKEHGSADTQAAWLTNQDTLHCPLRAFSVERTALGAPQTGSAPRIETADPKKADGLCVDG